MQLNQVQERWKQYENLVSSETIYRTLILPHQYMAEAIVNIIPDFSLASDGPIISGVFITTKQYLCEVRLLNSGEEFDIIQINSIFNVRFKLGTHVAIRNAAAIELAKSKGEKAPKPDQIEYQKAEFLIHHFYQDVHTEMNYFGQARDQWLKSVSSSFPVTVLNDSVAR